MAPLTWPPRREAPLVARLARRRTSATDPGERTDPPARAGTWQRAASQRRLLLLLLSVAQTVCGTWMLVGAMPYHGGQPMEIAAACLFAILFCWISAGFWTAMMGFFVLLRGCDRHAISLADAGDAALPPEARTAVVMPICNENVARVFAGLRATHDSLSRNGVLGNFDFFVLSDSSDPDTRVAETHAWDALCRDTGGYNRIFYRWRRHRIKRKSGNLADFCRRWGRNYKYMVVLDADSVMSGGCLAGLARLMEAHPGAGIIQSVPHPTGRDTLYARIQQFASRAYGPIYIAGLNFWQLGESHYWGHNAIIRVAPFMRHCALGRMPGRGPLSGDILSHDFVEAALMRRAGWSVWMAHDLPGSYEEMPPNLADELKRDRRWCRGNLVNSRLFFAQGVHAAHRAVFVSGVFAYVSAPLWFLLLVLSTVQLAVTSFAIPVYFVEPHQLFPLWPSWRVGWAILLFGVTALLLFLPKLLSVGMILAQDAERFGGRLRVIGSMLGEMVFSTLLAPVRMLFHTQFVIEGLSGTSFQWKSPPREDTQTGWVEAVRRHGWHTLLGIAWAGLVYWINPAFLLWLLPVIAALVLGIPLSALSSRASLGRAARARGWFLIPEEAKTPLELMQTREAYLSTPPSPGFLEAVDQAEVNATLRGCTPERVGPAVRRRRESLLVVVKKRGLEALDAAQCMHLLDDALALLTLHHERNAAVAARRSALL
jgi:membrane glycosyltransferase